MDGDLSIPSYFSSHVGAESFLVLEMKYLWGRFNKKFLSSLFKVIRGQNMTCVKKIIYRSKLADTFPYNKKLYNIKLIKYNILSNT